jgi:hypothetical protein
VNPGSTPVVSGSSGIVRPADDSVAGLLRLVTAAGASAWRQDLPLPPGSRVVVVSSGAAISGAGQGTRLGCRTFDLGRISGTNQ